MKQVSLETVTQGYVHVTFSNDPGDLLDAEIALACDLQFASLERTILGQPEVPSGMLSRGRRHRAA